MTVMLYDGYNAWDECPEADDCELIRSFLELVDAMVRDIQHLKAEAVRARYQLAMETDPERKQIITVDILSDLDMPHYDSLAYQEFSRICCFLQALFPQKCRLNSSKLHGEFPQYCISSAGTLSGAGEEPLQAYKVY